MKLYLDTNVFLGWFKKNIVNIREDKPISDTKTMIKLKSFDATLYTSELSMIETVNYLKGSFSARKEEIDLLWNILTDLYYVRIIPVQTKWESIKNIVSKVSIKGKSIVDLLHLETAKKNKCKFATFDKELKKLSWRYDISFL
ncbi:MAG: type II toxin-antitoxin system VapC family toxin [Candidatus Aenigmarchaeota archaeon]|nr:type II toxin-antitoxin system VapC family toxin [Candidatus Aenigmarchaeota archaeon]